MRIDLLDVTMAYGQDTIIRDVNLVLNPGIFFLEGQNGSGKSTLIDIFSGRLRPTKGQVSAGNGRYSSYAKKHVSVCPDTHELPSLLTARQYLSFAAKLRHVAKSDARIADIARGMNFDLDNPGTISTYSRGMRQKLCILAAMVGFRSMILFDESFSALDATSRASLLKSLPDLVDKSTIEVIIMVNHTHDHQTLPSARRLICKNGKCEFHVAQDLKQVAKQ